MMKVRKKKGGVQPIAICIMGLITVFICLLFGLSQIQTEYATARLNESVSEAILSADYLDQYAQSTYGYTVLDCSGTDKPHCTHSSCMYSTDETAAYNQAYEKARTRFENSLKDSLHLGAGFAVTSQTPCGIAGVTIQDLRTYNVIDTSGSGILSEGRTYMKSPDASQWYDNTQTVTAPNGDEVLVSGVYADVVFTIRTFWSTTTDIPVRIFVGIRQ